MQQSPQWRNRHVAAQRPPYPEKPAPDAACIVHSSTVVCLKADNPTRAPIGTATSPPCAQRSDTCNFFIPDSSLAMSLLKSGSERTGTPLR